MLPGPPDDRVRMRLALTILGATQLVIGAWLAIAPDSFVDAIAPFGPADHHFLRDLATFQAGIGIALLAAAGRPAWRVPVLFAALVQSALHTINHLFDIGGHGPGLAGPLQLRAPAAADGGVRLLMQEAGERRARRRHARTALGEAAGVRVFLAGATGVIGRRLVPCCSRPGTT